MDARSTIAIGALIFCIGLGVTVATFSAAQGGGTYVVAYGAIIAGAFQIVRGISLLGDEKAEAEVEVAVPAKFVEGAITEDDYPAAALRGDAEGRVTVGYFVDEQGSVTYPSIVQSSGHSALDQATVRILSDRFVFSPALNALGNPIAQYQETSVNWRLPLD
ncbi:MAG: periplasmic protein TonB [Sphingomonadales bacterium]|jgi:TonB family protein|nr:periplasmic protein TonB [Sphingomonadales bacterium]